ncbi:MAG: glycoside hydrolase family 2 TIM barrel-domain containing protein [Candidatus Ventricola sp.]|nr:glycoside hydrolase family 2 TIM barrel-domain containing protein [Candidatus Ventricola sp.]
MNAFDLSGTWRCETGEGCAPAQLPGTLDTNGIGHADLTAAPWHPDENVNDALASQDVIATRLTRRHTYEGAAVFTRALSFVPPVGKRVFLFCERTRRLSLRVNGQEVPPFLPASLSTPVLFELTGLLTGRDELALTCDNRYPGWPHDDIVFSSAATDETQTNWNGVIGELSLRVEEPVFIHALRAYPRGDALDVWLEISADRAFQADVAVTSDALTTPVSITAQGGPGFSSVALRGLPLRADVRRWDEGEGNQYALSASLGGVAKTVSFGVRTFCAQNGRFVLNGRPLFLRGETNCAVFPETGHPPTDVASWRHILAVYQSYGVNCVRFHSHCPPEAAFIAADETGMLMQPELSHWNPRNAFSSPESRAYYRAELEGVLCMLANHPSFVMLTLGNELHMNEDGQAFADSLLALARSIDPTRLYAAGSNNHYGAKGPNPADDFYAACCCRAHALRATSSPMTGWLNERCPDLRTDYAPAMRAIRAVSDQPVLSFEVGQYEVLPDFDELAAFRGVTRPDNLRLIRSRVEAASLLPRWRTYVEATGELALRCYRAEVEAALRTEGLSGLFLLGLQDFPGQGTALVGMMDSHLSPKPYAFAQPERFARFFTAVLALVLLPRLTYTARETLAADVRVANYGRQTLGGVPVWTLEGGGVSLRGTLPYARAACGAATDLGSISVPLDGIKKAARLTLTVSLCGHENSYDLWVYPDEPAVCPERVYECRTLDARALQVLQRGGRVFLAPDSTQEALPHSIRGQFSTDFWSVGTFPAQAGGMGQLIDAAHPVFSSFPTDAHTDFQWWPMASRRAVILPEALQSLRPIVTLMDSYAYLRPMAQLLECRCGGGRLLFSSLGLHHLTQYPEARALLFSIYRYMGSEAFAPAQEAPVEEIRTILA